MSREITLRIIVSGSPLGVAWALQRGRDQIEQAVRAQGGDLVFEASARVRAITPEGVVDLGGPFVQGPPGRRFVYLCSGRSAGDLQSCWQRRAKVPLGSIPADLAEAAVVAARIHGTARDGGPACATVPLLGGGWTPA